MKNPFTRYELQFNVPMPLLKDDWTRSSRHLTRRGGESRAEIVGLMIGGVAEFRVIDTWRESK